MFYFLRTLRSQSKVHKHLSSASHALSPEVRASTAPARLVTLPNPARYVARAHERKRAPRLATPTYLVQCSFNCLCASLSLSLFGAPPQKDFEARPPKKSEGFRARHGSGKWLALGQPGGVGRGQGLCVRHGRGRSLALGQATRWCATLRRALRGATRWCACTARHCNSALCLSFLLRIFSGAAKAPWRPAPERIRSKNERLGAQSFTRRYEMVRDTVTDRAPRAFKEQAPGSKRTGRASP